jgi:NAD(P)-dependent dehydrogenase (short-subunit alcohol dehydrogenase family)
MYAIVSPSPSLYSHFNSGLGSIKNPAYGASKAALISLCNQYATHFAPTGQRFNLLTLGGIAGSQDEEFKEKFNRKVPMQRMGNPDELGGALVFLLSSASSYMTGHNLILDGGFTKW